MSNWPRTGCSTIVIEGNRVLLIKRGKQPFEGFWSLPGGGQEHGETLEVCARRELKEETGLITDNLKIVSATDRIVRDEDGSVTHHFVLVTFLAGATTGIPQANDDANDLDWFTLSEMQSLEMTPDTLKLLEEVLCQ